MEKFDKLDKKILQLLQNDSTLNTKQIADEVGLSITPTYERIKRMERTGVIEKYVALVNKEKIGKNLYIFHSSKHPNPLIFKISHYEITF